MFTVNSLIQDACEDLSLVGDGDAVSPETAASCEGLLNRAIAGLNSDNYISLSVRTYDVNAAGSVYFKKLEDGETPSQNVVDQEPPDAVQGVSRQVGIRWLQLHPSNPQEMDRVLTYSFPTLWSYEVVQDVAPSGNERRMGVLKLNGTNPAQLRIYENSRLPQYRLGDTIYLSPLYRNLVLYSLEEKMIDKYKLYSYSDKVERELGKAMRAIDTNTANNRPLTNGTEGIGDYLSPYYNLLGGLGL